VNPQNPFLRIFEKWRWRFTSYTGVLRLTLHQGLGCGCEGSVVMLHAAAEAENRDDVDWFADVQHDFMGLRMMPKACEQLLQCLSSGHLQSNINV
jgi:hypothetical protein